MNGMIERVLRAWIVLQVFAATVLMTVAPATSAKTVPVSSVVADHGHLRVSGNRVVDAHGRPFAVHGMSLFWSNAKPRFYNASAIRWTVTDWHATAVRAAIAAGSGDWKQEPAEQIRLACQAIDAAIDAGIYVVVDWHAHDPMPDEAIRFFTQIARQYRGVPNVIYETWNEPLPKYGWSDVIKPYHLRVIAAIRQEDPSAFVVAGTRSWDQDVDEAAADPLGLPDVAYALHYYAATHKADLRAKAEAASQLGAALFVTEYGLTAANGDAPLDLDEARTWWRWCDALGISYLNWSLSDKAEASAALRPGSAATGGWPLDALTESGGHVRDQLRMASDSSANNRRPASRARRR